MTGKGANLVVFVLHRRKPGRQTSLRIAVHRPGQKFQAPGDQKIKQNIYGQGDNQNGRYGDVEKHAVIGSDLGESRAHGNRDVHSAAYVADLVALAGVTAQALLLDLQRGHVAQSVRTGDFFNGDGFGCPLGKIFQGAPLKIIRCIEGIDRLQAGHIELSHPFPGGINGKLPGHHGRIAFDQPVASLIADGPLLEKRVILNPGLFYKEEPVVISNPLTRQANLMKQHLGLARRLLNHKVFLKTRGSVKSHPVRAKGDQSHHQNKFGFQLHDSHPPFQRYTTTCYRKVTHVPHRRYPRVTHPYTQSSQHTVLKHFLRWHTRCYHYLVKHD